VTAFAVAVFLMLAPGAMRSSAAVTEGTTYVSITFDDGLAQQYVARDMLSSRGMHATFYANSGTIGTSATYLTWQQLSDLQSDGNEIAGHTVLHEDALTMNADEQAREICNDRATLMSRGFQVTDFAYPFGSWNAQTNAIVQQCGYDTSRNGTEFGEFDPPLTAESVPPPDMFDLRTPPGVESTTTLADIEQRVTDAETHGGGWVEIRIHHICDGCDPTSITQANLAAFLDWLAPRAANGTLVRTVHEVFGGAVNPAVPGPDAPTPGSGFGNASLETSTFVPGTPDCWEPQGFGVNSYSFSRTSDAHSGNFAEQLDITNYTSGARYLTGKRDLGQCSPSVVPGTTYRLGVWYKSTAPVRFTPFYRDSPGAWRNLGSGSIAFPAASTWTELHWITPAMPADATGMTFGLQLQSVGSLTTDDYSVSDTEAVPPTVGITAPTSGSTVAGTTTVTADASDNVAVDHVDFFRNGILIGTDTTAPYEIPWDTTTASNGSQTLTAVAVDTSVNSTTSAPVSVSVANSPAVGVNNYSLEGDVDGNGMPDCWEPRGSAPSSTGTFTRTSDAHTGAFAERVDYAPQTIGQDQKLMTAFDTRCAPAVTGGSQYQLSVWYKSTTPVRFFAYTRTTGSFSFFKQSPLLPAAATWTHAVWTPQALPAGATYLSFGLGIDTAGSVTTDDYNFAPAGDVTTPTVSLTAPLTNSTVSGTAVTISANAADNVGVDRVVFSVDGAVVGSDDTSPYAIAWNSRTVANGAHTVTATVFDTSGNTQTAGPRPFNTQNDLTVPSVTLTAPADGANVTGTAVPVTADASDNVAVDHVDFYVDTNVVGTDSTTPYETSWNSRSVTNGTHAVSAVAYDSSGNTATSAASSITVTNDFGAPTTSIACDGGSCNPWFAADGTLVSLTAADDASGVAAIRYTLDGSTPDETSTSYDNVPFAVGQTTTVKYRAWDNDGNVEDVNTQQIQIDGVAPATGVACNGSACGSGWYMPPSIALSAADTGGSGLDRTVYTTDGSTPTLLNGTTYSGPFPLTTTSTVQYRSFDVAGNAEDVQSQFVQVDSVAPSTSISCNGGSCSPWFSGSTLVTLSATDDDSGLAVIRYTIDGSTPTGSSPSYIGPFAVGVTTTVQYRAWDNAGNVEAVGTQQVRIDSVAPTTSITCNGSTCSTGWYTSASIALSAADTGGSGLDRTVYTTDGSTPTLLNGTTYSGPFSLTTATTVQYRSFDVAGNAETVRSRLVQADSIAPSTSISCNGAACASWYDGPGSVSVSLSRADTGGSGILRTVYTVDGSTPTLTHGTTYTAPFAVTTTRTVLYRSFDVAGNAESVQSQLIRFDSTAPSTTIRCNNGNCNGWFAAVSIALTATDTGSGVDRTVYTTDGSTPTLQNGTTYTGPFALTTTTTVRYRSFDLVGNAENVKSSLVQVDAIAPSVAITQPVNGAIVTGSVTIAASATDTGGSGMDSVRFYVDGVLLGTDNSTPYTKSWATRGVTRGQHTLTVVAADRAGNTRTSAPVVVTVA
jgi:peptidoglycan/xylan/chitin deacetylase (PgdA/CDA1 family)